MEASIPKSIYGPVRSWRLGRSLGVDVLCLDSICSFECVYCQLGKINRVTGERGVFVSTEKVLRDLENSGWKEADVITFSGSGEPTLAKNLGEIIERIRKMTGKPIIVLTNSTLLHDREVRSEIGLADKIFCKLDAWSDDVLRRVDRPARGISLDSIISGIRLLRKEYPRFLAVQTMILRLPEPPELEKLAEILRSIRPEEVQLNLPTRPVPHEYFLETRGNEVEFDPGFKRLKTISGEELEEIRRHLSDLTGLTLVARG
ncbi:MAG: radical SAM protein [Pyrinomonadaceae bacterium]